jgi:hypothetical protein
MKINKKCEEMRRLIGFNLNRHQKAKMICGDKYLRDGWLTVYIRKK